MRSKYLDYKDTFITIFSDWDKMLLCFVTDTGKSKVVSLDDNFFYVEELIDTYYEMIVQSFMGWRNDYSALNEGDWKEIKEHLEKYVRYIKKESTIDLTLCNDDVKALLDVKEQ